MYLIWWRGGPLPPVRTPPRPGSAAEIEEDGMDEGAGLNDAHDRAEAPLLIRKGVATWVMVLPAVTLAGRRGFGIDDMDISSDESYASDLLRIVFIIGL